MTLEEKVSSMIANGPGNDPWKESNEAWEAIAAKRRARIEALKRIARVTGTVSVERAVLTFEDGSTLDLSKLVNL